MPEFISSEVESQIKLLHSLNYSNRMIVKTLNNQEIRLSQSSVNRVINLIGKKRQCDRNGEKYTFDHVRTKQTQQLLLKFYEK